MTRYFGGILLGGGLVRAYTQSAKDALDAAGISVVRRWVEVAVPCPYFFERLKLELEAHGGCWGGGVRRRRHGARPAARGAGRGLRPAHRAGRRRSGRPGVRRVLPGGAPDTSMNKS